jgi:hypothetical protein
VNGRCLHQELGFHPNLLISSMVHTLQATLAMLGYGCRIPLLLHGSEYEANTYRCDDDKVVFDETGLYDAVHQKVLEHYLRSLGDFRFTSLLYPLSNFQTQSLLLRRYPHLVSVQGSCFFGSGEWCSTCPKCFRIAAIMLANGQDPAQYGIEMAKLIRHVYRHIRQDIQAVQRGQTGKMTPNIYRALQIIKDRRSPELTRMMAGANGWPGLYSRVLWAYLLRTVDPHLDFRDVDQYHPALMALCTVRDQVEALYLSLWETGPTDRSEQYQTLQNLIDSVCGVESA